MPDVMASGERARLIGRIEGALALARQHATGGASADAADLQRLLASEREAALATVQTPTHSADTRESEVGVRFLGAHPNAGVAVWAPDLEHAARMVVEVGADRAELVQRRVDEWQPLRPPAAG